MAVPPSRESWVWHLATQTMEHCCGVGTRIEDLEVEVAELDGVAVVSVSDWTFKRRGVPMLVAAGAIPGADSSVKAELWRAIETEQRRLGRKAPVE